VRKRGTGIVKKRKDKVWRPPDTGFGCLPLDLGGREGESKVRKEQMPGETHMNIGRKRVDGGQKETSVKANRASFWRTIPGRGGGGGGLDRLMIHTKRESGSLHETHSFFLGLTINTSQERAEGRSQEGIASWRWSKEPVRKKKTVA